MKNHPKTSDPAKPAPDGDKPADTSEIAKRPRRLTLEELLAGMTPGEKSEFQDDWPVGEELI